MSPMKPGWFITLLIWLAAACGEEPEPAVATHVDDWRDEVIYQVVTDRFDNGDTGNDSAGGVGPDPTNLARYQGGDWKGLTRRLDYIRELGGTTVWISPLVAGQDRMGKWDGYHGYWALDFTRHNPHFGDVADLRELTRQAHRRGMKVILDMVTNHTSQVFFYDLDGDGKATDSERFPTFSTPGPYKAPLVWLTPRPRLFRYATGSRVGEPAELEISDKHFHRRGQISDFTSRTHMELGDFPTGLRDLDTENQELLDAMVDTYTYWVGRTDVDGFRVDAVPHVGHAFWAGFSRQLRLALAARGKNKFLLLGEAFHRDPKIVASYTRAGELDSVFDFSLKWEVIDGFILDGKAASTTLKALEIYRSLYSTVAQPGGVGLTPWQARVSFADNHDMKRLRGELNDANAAELAMTLVFTVDAIPAVYYGTEQGFSGGGDHDSREVMWKTGFPTTHRTFRHIKLLAGLRRSTPALRRGALVSRYASKISARETGPGAGLLCFERVLEKQRALVAINGHPLQVAVARVQTGFPPGTRLRDALGVSGVTLLADSESKVSLSVPQRKAQIWIVAN